MKKVRIILSAIACSIALSVAAFNSMPSSQAEYRVDQSGDLFIPITPAAGHDCIHNPSLNCKRLYDVVNGQPTNPVKESTIVPGEFF